MPSAYKLLQFALAAFGVVMLLRYPLAVVWPSGWAWGAPYQSHLFMMIVGMYATLGVFVLNAAPNPAANLSLIWFTVVSSAVHAAIMAAQSFSEDHMGHLWGDVPALLLVAVVLSVLVQSPASSSLLLPEFCMLIVWAVAFDPPPLHGVRLSRKRWVDATETSRRRHTCFRAQ